MEKNKGNFFTRLFARNKEGEPDQKEIIDETTLPTTAEALPYTMLTFTPLQIKDIPFPERVELQSKLEEAPPLRVGEINFVPFEVGSFEDGFFVKVFIRNGKDLEEEFTLQEVDLSLIDAGGDKIVGGTFYPENFGTLRFGDTRYWVFAWRANELTKQNPDFSSFTIEFEK